MGFNQTQHYTTLHNRYPAMDSSANFYARLLKKQNWLKQKRKQLQYPDKSMKDAPVPPRFPIPQCVCGEPAEIIQSTHPATAARAYYTCGHHLVSISFARIDFRQR